HRLADAPDPASDAALLDRYACRRDGAAFAAPLARPGPMGYRTSRPALADAGAGAGAFHATFLGLAREARGPRRPAALAGWPAVGRPRWPVGCRAWRCGWPSRPAGWRHGGTPGGGLPGRPSRPTRGPTRWTS